MAAMFCVWSKTQCVYMDTNSMDDCTYYTKDFYSDRKANRRSNRDQSAILEKAIWKKEKQRHLINDEVRGGMDVVFKGRRNMFKN